MRYERRKRKDEYGIKEENLPDLEKLNVRFSFARNNYQKCGSNPELSVLFNSLFPSSGLCIKLCILIFN